MVVQWLYGWKNRTYITSVLSLSATTWNFFVCLTFLTRRQFKPTRINLEITDMNIVATSVIYCEMGFLWISVKLSICLQLFLFVFSFSISKDRLTYLSIPTIEHEYLKISFDEVIDKFAEIKNKKQIIIFIMYYYGRPTYRYRHIF